MSNKSYKTVHAAEATHCVETKVSIPNDTFDISLFTSDDGNPFDFGKRHHQLILRFIRNRQGDIIQGNQEPTIKAVWQKYEGGTTHSFDLPYEEFWEILTDALDKRCEQDCPEGNPGPNTLAVDEVGQASDSKHRK